jgi:hypothetical protein
MFKPKRYQPFRRRHRWFIYFPFILLMSGTLFMLGLRTVQVALAAVLAYYIAWILQPG